MKQTNYINNLPSQFRSSASSAGVDPVSVNIARYGFSQNNLMTQSLGTSLETTRLTSQIIGNLQEVAIQPSKLYILAPFAKLSFNYLNTLNQQSAKQSLGVVDQLLPVMNTLMVV